MERISVYGSQYFYQGPFSKRLIEAKVGITADDLTTYNVV